MFNEVVDLMRHSDYTWSWKGHRHQKKKEAGRWAAFSFSRPSAWQLIRDLPQGCSIVVIVVVMAVAVLA